MARWPMAALLSEAGRDWRTRVTPLPKGSSSKKRVSRLVSISTLTGSVRLQPLVHARSARERCRISPLYPGNDCADRLRVPAAPAHKAPGSARWR